MRSPDPTPEQLAEDRHTFARANGSPCGPDCARCYPHPRPRNRQEQRSLVFQGTPFTSEETRRLAPTLRARTVRGVR